MFSIPEKTEYKIAMAYFKVLFQHTGLELNISCNEVFLGSVYWVCLVPTITYMFTSLILHSF